jgi:hypothetical protein
MRAVTGSFSWRPGDQSLAILRRASQDERWRLVLAARQVALRLNLSIVEPNFQPEHRIAYYHAVSRLFEDRVTREPFDEVPMWIDTGTAASVTGCPEAAPTARNFRYQMYRCGAQALIGEPREWCTCECSSAWS